MKCELSWWESEHFLKGLDYTIIGSGIVGISTAIELKNVEPKAKILVLDKKIAPIGASTKNAGFACFGSISEIYDDYNSFGEDICRKLIQMRWKGLGLMKSRISENKMNYKSTPGAEVFQEKGTFDIYEEKLSWLNSFVSDIVDNNCCFNSQNGKFGNEIINNLEGSLNPQMMMYELEMIARNLGVLFWEGVEVHEIINAEKTIDTNMGKIEYNKLIVCTNGFSRRLLPKSEIRPARNQVFITNKIRGFDLNYCYHMNKGYVYFREIDGRLLIGGGRDLDPEGETTEELGTTKTITNYLRNIVDHCILPNQPYTIEHSWSGILGIGESKMPIVKMIDKDVLIAVRMGGMGVAIGSFIGKVAASMILSFDNRALQLYVN